jgi:hypothetical protein
LWIETRKQKPNLWSRELNWMEHAKESNPIQSNPLTFYTLHCIALSSP